MAWKKFFGFFDRGKKPDAPHTYTTGFGRNRREKIPVEARIATSKQKALGRALQNLKTSGRVKEAKALESGNPLVKITVSRTEFPELARGISALGYTPEHQNLVNGELTHRFENGSEVIFRKI